MPLFQIILVLSFLILMIIVNRLYQALRILNSRVEILSNLVKNMRMELKNAEEDEAIQEYLSRETMLQAEMGSSFSYNASPRSRYSGKSLLRSNIFPAADTPVPATRSPHAEESSSSQEELLSQYQVMEEGSKVSIKKDLSYLSKSSKDPDSAHNPVSIDQIPALPIFPTAGSLTPQAEKEGK